MTLTQFRSLIRAYVPGAKKVVASNTLLDLIINKGAADVNYYAGALKDNKKFAVTAEQQEYVFSDVLPEYVKMEAAGLWWNDGDATTTEWTRLDALTRESLSNDWPNWLDDDSDSPIRYITENDILTIHPKPSADLTNGFWAFFVKKSVDMTAGTHYPFTGSTVEIASLTVLDDAIIDYVRWKLADVVGKDQKGILTQQQYEKNRAERIRLLDQRFDITGTPGIRMRGPNIGR